MPGEMAYTTRVDGTGKWYLGQLGHVGGLVFSDTINGAEAATLSLERDTSQRHEAFAPGRRLVVLKGSAQWEGTLTEPVAGDGAWNLSADGAGTWGNRYRAIYTPPWTVNTPHDVINSAISGRGLRWIEGSLAGADISQPVDPAAQSISEFLDGITSGQSWSWRVKRVHAGLQLDLFTLPDPKPSTCTRLLVTTSPVARTLAGYVNAMYARYQKTVDTTGTPATFDLGSAVNQPSIDAHDRHEEFWDLTSAGVLSGAAVNVKAGQALSKYSATSYSSALTVHRGQYMTAGGTPVDLACEKAGEVVKLIVADGPYGGEIRTGPICFTVGRVSYDSDNDSLEVTPLQSWHNSLSDVLTLIAPKAPA